LRAFLFLDQVKKAYLLLLLLIVACSVNGQSETVQLIKKHCEHIDSLVEHKLTENVTKYGEDEYDGAAFAEFYKGQLVYMLAAYGGDSGGADFHCYFDKNEHLVLCKATYYEYTRIEEKTTVTTEKEDTYFQQQKVIFWANEKGIPFVKTPTEKEAHFESLSETIQSYVERLKTKE
jgi:hypothetical protein